MNVQKYFFKPALIGLIFFLTILLLPYFLYMQYVNGIDPPLFLAIIYISICSVIVSSTLILPVLYFIGYKRMLTGMIYSGTGCTVTSIIASSIVIFNFHENLYGLLIESMLLFMLLAIKNFFTNYFLLLSFYSLILISSDKLAFPMILLLPISFVFMRIDDVMSIVIPITGIYGFIIIVLKLLNVKRIAHQTILLTSGIACLWLSVIVAYIRTGVEHQINKPFFLFLPEFFFSVSSILILFDLQKRNTQRK